MSITNTARTGWVYGANNGSRPSNMTLAGWVNASANPSASTTGVFLSLGNIAGYPNDQGNIECKWDDTGTNIHSAVFHNGTTSYVKIDMGTVVGSTWYHFAITRTATVGELFKNGASQGTVALSGSYSSAIWYFSMLAGRGSAGTDPAAGSVSMAGWWDAILTPAEINSLALGFSPRMVRPQNLKDFFPGISNANNYRNAASTTAGSGGVSFTTSPRVMF